MESQKIILSLNTNQVTPVIYCSQYDKGRIYTATIIDVDGSPYIFSDESVVICGTKSSGTGFSYDADCKASTVNFILTEQMSSVAGFVRCQFIVMKDGLKMGTMAFMIYVQPAALTTDTIIDSDDFQSIILDAAETYLEEAGVVMAPYTSWPANDIFVANGIYQLGTQSGSKTIVFADGSRATDMIYISFVAGSDLALSYSGRYAGLNSLAITTGSLTELIGIWNTALDAWVFVSREVIL